MKNDVKKRKKIRHEGHLVSELTKLSSLEKFIENVQERLNRLYAKIYPKKCHHCGAVYYSRGEYLKATLENDTIGSSHSSMVIEDEGKIMEFRNCHCGATLVVIMGSRRDQSNFGQKRRELFQKCVKKLMEKEGLKKVEAVTMVRFIFRYCISLNGSQGEIENKKFSKVG